MKIKEYIKKYKESHKYHITLDKDYSKYITLSDDYSTLHDTPNMFRLRPVENVNAPNSIMIFGCSVAYGNELSNTETFSYNLGKYLDNYAIYNRSIRAWSTSHMLYQLENKEFSDVKNVKYVIYVFIQDHFIRNINSPYVLGTPYYVSTKNNIKFQKYSIKYMQFPLAIYKREFEHKIMYSKLISGNKKLEKVINHTKEMIQYSKLLLDFTYENKVKFIILRYDKGIDEPYDKMFEELKQDGIIVVSLKDLSDKQYTLDLEYKISKEDEHPNAKAWKEITPLFVKYLQDRGYFKD